jgi:hypothetical protein
VDGNRGKEISLKHPCVLLNLFILIPSVNNAAFCCKQ